jgi:hypothetical protein
MGPPTSAIIAEIFIQFFKHTAIYKILEKHQIFDYYIYADDILIMYNSERINIHNTLQEFNTLRPKLNFTLENESHGKLIYIDITINKQHKKVTSEISRKPTTTDTILHNSSCHPNEHKRSAINYLISLHQKAKHKIKLLSTRYSLITATTNKLHIKNRTQRNQYSTENKMPNLPLSHPDTRTITKLFRNTNLKIAYKTTNSLKHHLKPKNHN